MKIEIKNVCQSFSGKQVFKDLNLTIEDKKISCILGPSGCGKTTLLNIIAGIQRFDSGKIYPAPPLKVSYLFQESRLLPWFTALENVMYLMDDSLSKRYKKFKAIDLLYNIGLVGYENHYPHELSGGMARRVALVRVLAHPSSVLLLDEPFVSLDSELKFEIVELIRTLIQQEQRTAVCVTHDLMVAEKFGDILIILEKSDKVTDMANVKIKRNLSKNYSRENFLDFVK